MTLATAVMSLFSAKNWIVASTSDPCPGGSMRAARTLISALGDFSAKKTEWSAGGITTWCERL
jgi:hypothetical protein